MSILAAAQNYRNQQLPETAIKSPSRWFRDWLDGEDTPSGIKVDADNAISLSTVFNALTLLSESTAQLPVAPHRTIEVDGQERNEKYKDHISYPLVSKRPNEWMSSHTFRKAMMNQAVRYDRAYALITRNGRGQPVELFPIPSKYVQTKITSDRRLIYEVTDFYGTGQTEVVSAMNMLHIIGYTENGLEGKSRIKIASEGIGNAKAAERFTGHYFGKGVNVSGFIKTPKLLKDEEAVERLKSSFAKKYGGQNGQFGVGVLEDGAEWEKNEVEPEKAQMNETRKVNGQVVAQIWNIPLPLLKYLDNATYNNVEQLDIQFTKYTLMPWLVNWEQELERKLLSEREKQAGNIYFKHNLTAMLRGDMDSRGQFYERMQRTGAMSPNDIREKEDMNPYEGGDIHVINPGAQSVENLNNETDEE